VATAFSLIGLYIVRHTVAWLASEIMTAQSVWFLKRCLKDKMSTGVHTQRQTDRLTESERERERLWKLLLWCKPTEKVCNENWTTLRNYVLARLPEVSAPQYFYYVPSTKHLSCRFHLLTTWRDCCSKTLW